MNSQIEDYKQHPENYGSRIINDMKKSNNPGIFIGIIVMSPWILAESIFFPRNPPQEPFNVFLKQLSYKSIGLGLSLYILNKKVGVNIFKQPRLYNKIAKK